MKSRHQAILSAVVLGLFSSTALSHWEPGDPHKMHFPQMPDPVGWDIKMDEWGMLADDFLCTETGPITEVHFWGSWQGDIIGQLTNIEITLFLDIPAQPEIPGSYSRPGAQLWQYNTWVHDPALVSVGPPQTGLQGWYDPVNEIVFPEDHTQFFQYNVKIAPGEWFPQEEGTIYWLGLHVTVSDAIPGSQFGWKTSLDHWNDDAVYMDFEFEWQELYDPMLPGVSLDMAFVIVPEPSHAALGLGLAMIGGLFFRRRHRR